jgi:hypothetical protein
MKRFMLTCLTGTVALVLGATLLVHHADSGPRTGPTGHDARGVSAPPSGETDVPRHGLVPQTGPLGRPTDEPEAAEVPAPAASPAPYESEPAADRTLAAFMDARMARSAPDAMEYLSAVAFHETCDDRFCTMLVGTSNPHYVSWEILSETDEGEGKVLFAVRIHEETTGEEHVDQVDELIEVGPGENYLGEHMDAVVLYLEQ